MTQRPCAGLLLTGGASRRMGTDKALIEVDGQRLAERAAAVLAAVADPVVEVGPGWSPLPAVREDPPGSGPLAAVSTGAAALRRRGHAGRAAPSAGRAMMVTMPAPPLSSPAPSPAPEPEPGSAPAPVRRTVTSSRALAWRDGQAIERPERLATEEPMEIRASGPGQEPASVAVTMRTPGHDFELAVGFLVGEGLVRGRDEVASVRYCDLPPDEPQLYNVVSVFLTGPFEPAGAERRFYTTSSCGICGKASLDQVEVHCAAIPPGPPLPASVVVSLPDALPRAHRIFEQTGGLHGAGAFDL